MAMANTKLRDDLADDLDAMETPEEAIVALLITVAERIEASRGNDGKLKEYVKSLRDGSDQVTNALLAKVPAGKK